MANPFKGEYKYCTKCGSRIRKDSRFCIECGTEFFLGLENERAVNLKQNKGRKRDISNLSNKKKILILIFVLIFGIGQFIFIFLGQSKLIWKYNGLLSGTSPWGGVLTINIPSNPSSSNKYVIEASGTFAYVGSGEHGNVTFIHVDSNQIFFFEYDIGSGPFIATEYDRKTWTLPPGEYTIIWHSSTMNPHFELWAVGIFFPNDDIAIPVSGLSALFCAIGVIYLISKIRKNSQ
ncbi:hypothetical protein LCGC14_1695760 [marine sediment metagenome]|uniref:Zinc-ribbon domain-containing protein n=1 Tax=marine sediment metagenome TaxID=412755 RepID=A0A0F9HJY5_9ZZZZ